MNCLDGIAYCKTDSLVQIHFTTDMDHPIAGCQEDGGVQHFFWGSLLQRGGTGKTKNLTV